MRICYFAITALIFFATSCNSKSISDSDIIVTDIGVDYQQSKTLIERYNRLREVNKLNRIIQDTILDDICKTLISKRAYRNSDNTFIEDSVRKLLYENGAIDYQYEIKEFSDIDTTAIFKSFLLADNSSCIRMGYRKYADRHILFKTISYLHFITWETASHSNPISLLDNKGVKSATFNTEFVICNLKTSQPGNYYYQFCNHIPLSRERLKCNKKNLVEALKTSITGDDSDIYEIKIKSTDPDAFFIILNKNKERIAVLK